jgi:hypothetical protein
VGSELPQVDHLDEPRVHSLDQAIGIPGRRHWACARRSHGSKLRIPARASSTGPTSTSPVPGSNRA